MDQLKYRIVRLRPSYIDLCNFLEYRAKKAHYYKSLHEEIFKFSFDYIEKNGLKYRINPSDMERKGKGFMLSDDTFDKYGNLFNQLRTTEYKIFKGELAEILVYIYAINNLTKQELLLVDINFEIFESTILL